MFTYLVLLRTLALALTLTKNYSMKKLLYLITILFAILLSACETDDTITQVAYRKPIVECFINSEVDTITIKFSEMIQYLGEDDDSLADPIIGLNVYVMKSESDSILLEEKKPGVYQSSFSEIGASIGDSIRFSTYIDNYRLSSDTWLPPKPTSIDINDDIIYIDPDNRMGMMMNSDLTLSWDNPEEAFYYISMENLESDPVPVNEMVEGMPTLRQTPPSQGDQYEIRIRNIMYFGTYRVILFRVNQEFANLFDNPTMSPVSLTEPPSNIKNGLGIFTAFSTDTVFFEVKEQ